MQYFGIFDRQGLPLAFYNDDVWPVGKIPSGAVKISEAVWREFITNQGRRKWTGGKIAEYTGTASPEVPVTVVTAAQAKIALYQAGLLDAVEAAVGAHPYPPVRIWYADASEWQRAFPYVQALGVEMGLTDAQMDALFKTASLIV